MIYPTRYGEIKVVVQIIRLWLPIKSTSVLINTDSDIFAEVTILFRIYRIMKGSIEYEKNQYYRGT